MSIRDKKREKNQCNICTRNIRGNAKAVCCGFCENWIHIHCNFISNSKYNELKQNNEPFICIKCLNTELPFGLEDDKIFNQSVSLGLDNPNIENLQFQISKNEKKLINL